ncbi:aldehyde dehydrogenase family protein [Actinophytocola sp.]|uniref:aldehyde dehydrogenase family protein n=1 Tax=Actinophytocola sp. TaxID=1872138 RepID=UPI002ED21A72
MFAAFVREVVTEMTVKAGQKCTAIRRVLVPAEFETTALDAISAELSTVVIGNPASDGARSEEGRVCRRRPRGTAACTSWTR